MQAIQEQNSDAAHGLGSAEAARRLASAGQNTLPETKRRAFWQRCLSQFASPLIYILLVAALISIGMGHASDSVVILLVVFVNATIGIIQEGRAELSMEALQRLSALQCRVVRDGEECLLPAAQLVSGDVIVLLAGDAVPADARLLEASALQASEASLTGESLPVSKHVDPLHADAPVADRKNMIYAGTHIVFGRARALVVATGPKTEVGRIATLTTGAQKTKTPLELKLAQFGHWLVASAVVLFGAVVGFGLLRGMPLGEVFMVAISQMVSVVPEGLPVAMTIALAVGMQRMAKRGALVRRLAAVETLGSTSIICSDKTGTLTRNEMTVVALVLPDGRELTVTGSGYSPEGAVQMNGHVVTVNDAPMLRDLLEAAALCNDARLAPPDRHEARWRPLGDPTEAALLTLAMKGSVDLDELSRRLPRHDEIPFDPATKLMATQHGDGTKSRVVLKGAPEPLISLCDPATLDPLRMQMMAAQLASQALRVLAVAQAEGEPISGGDGFEAFRGKARFLGLIGQIDPPRKGAQAAIARCREAGIRPVMVTGDHRSTGLAIARMLGIARQGDIAVDGKELDKMAEHHLRANLDCISVFSRVHPAQKLRIVRAFQSQGHVVAMTGDGVNDAPALSAADVGVAMGISGTEVAKGAAKIVITDDNFATIVSSVEEGRLVYQNLRKVVLFLFTTSLDEVLVLLLALWCNYPLPLAAVQILWINIITEGAVTVNLIMEGPEGDEMKRNPIPRTESIVSRSMIHRLLLMAGTSTAAVFGFFIWRVSTGAPPALVQTETFTLMAVSQWFNVLNCRSSSQSALDLGLFKNMWLVGGLILGNLLQILVVYFEPLNHIFHTVPIPLADFFLIGAVGSSVLWIEEIRKWVARIWGRSAVTRGPREVAKATAGEAVVAQPSRSLH